MARPQKTEIDKEKLSGVFVEHDFLNSERAELARHLFGFGATGAIIHFWAAIGDSRDCMVDGVILQMIAAKYVPGDMIEKLISFCTNRSLLEVNEDGYFHSKLSERQVKVTQDREYWREKKRGQRRDKPGTNEGQTLDGVNSQESIVNSQESIDLNKEEPPPEPLAQLGEVLRMRPSEMEKLIEVFGKPLIDQELPEADVWLKEASTPNARKYRKPDHNHYLFMRTSWLPNKRLKNAPRTAASSPARGKITTVQRNKDLLQKLSDQEKGAQDAKLIGF